MAIVLVTHDSVYGRFLAASLVQEGAIDRLIIETARAPSRFYARKLKRVGPVNFVFQFWLNRWFAREGRRFLDPGPLPEHELVPSINGMSFPAEDLVIGFGTSYISPKTLAATPGGILNLHTGYLPWYRGVKPEFWALARGDGAMCGWTLHFMTSRIDGGDIVLQQRLDWYGTNPAELRAALLRDAVGAITQLADAFRERGQSALSRRPQGTGQYYTTPTWRQWRQFRRAARPT
jgi:hypothetical protein